MNDVQRIQDLYAAFGRGDVPAVLGGLAPDVQWREAENNPYQPTGDAWVGPDAVLENLFVRLGDEWDGFSVHPETIDGADGFVVMQGRYTGTCLATSKALDAQVCHVWRLANGRVTHFQQYVDTAHIRAVMGEV